MIIDAAQWLATATAVLTLPVLAIAQGLLRRHAWALPAAAVVHAASWWLLIRGLASIQLGASDWLAGAALLVALWLGWFQVSSVTRRGFSLQMMVELEAGTKTQAELEAGYADGRGLGWLLEKRLAGLEGSGLLRRQGDVLLLTAHGRLVARIARLYKGLTGIGAGG